MFRILILGFVGSQFILCILSVDAQESLAITWKDLAPPKVEDPFQKLSQQQVRELALVARIRNLVAAGKVEPDGPTAKEAGDIERRLAKSGVDVGYLLSMRDQVRRLREIQVNSVQATLQGKVVKLAGFVVPLKKSNHLVTEFLVVPTADSCSDANLPLPNQSVFVRAGDGIPDHGRQSAVRVTGRIEAKQTTCLIQRKLGVARFTASYTLAPLEIEVYSPKEDRQRDRR
jgi:hypothetical protein